MSFQDPNLKSNRLLYRKIEKLVKATSFIWKSMSEITQKLSLYMT